MEALAVRVREVLRAHVPRRSRLVVGFSGGIDSMVLLHVLVRQLRISPQRISAIHVNHQISPHAAAWAAFCRRCCRGLGIALHVEKVAVARGNSTEAAARDARLAVFAGSGADFVLLAHNRDDQAETLLLQLLRGAGPRGLAAMPVLKPAPGTMPSVLRPLLEVPRAEIEAHALRHHLQWVEDESNQDRAYLRNFLRHDVMPLLQGKLPAAGVTLARAARLQAEASDLLDVLAALDLAGAAGVSTGCLPLESLRRLDPARARNALRYFLRGHSVRMPDADRLEELLRQLLTARVDARISMRLDGLDLRCFRDALHVVPALPGLDRNYEQVWSGRRPLVLPQLGGTLRLVRQQGAGIAAHWLRAPLLVRVRRGGETLRPAAGGKRRTVRNLLQEAVLAPWQRERLPFLYVGDELAAVAGLGVDAGFLPDAGAPGYLPLWVPD